MSFSVLASTFLNNILPIILLSGAGFALGKALHVDPRSLGRVVFYIFSPVLIFDLLLQNQLKISEAAITIAFALCFILTIGALTFLLGYFLKLERSALVAILITTMFANTGNYGLPLVSFAFGEQALSYAGIYFVTTTLLFYTLGVFLASLGNMSFQEALLGLFKIPTLYAVLLALLINILGIEIPLPVARTVELAAGGTIPLMLILLGVQLTQVELARNQRALQLSVALRLVVAPLAALLFAAVFGLQGFPRQASVTQASMPSMVSATVLAAEYNLDSKLVTAVVFISTLLSPFTLTPLLVFLGR
ncbi:MAG TPA: AEC family transporter [Anaerolineales bacterium]|jgi:predicted permease|nr:AEC family transporter [Anaerolineales bacterium]